MRVGTFCRVTRLSSGITLRGFSSHLSIPHPSIAAVESGWLPPQTRLITSLKEYMPAQLNLHRYLETIFLRECSLRTLGDNLFYNISFFASGVVSAFLDHDDEYNFDWFDFRRILPGNLIPDLYVSVSNKELETRVYSYLFSCICDDLGKYSDLSTETKFKIIILLAKDMELIKPEDARKLRLTQPPPRAKKFIDAVTTVIARKPSTFNRFLETIRKPLPERVPDPFDSLDITLLLTERVEFNPINPGEITAYLTSHSNKKKKVVAYYPPWFDVPGVQFPDPSLRIEEISK